MHVLGKIRFAHSTRSDGPVAPIVPELSPNLVAHNRPRWLLQKDSIFAQASHRPSALVALHVNGRGTIQAGKSYASISWRD